MEVNTKIRIKLSCTVSEILRFEILDIYQKAMNFNYLINIYEVFFDVIVEHWNFKHFKMLISFDI